MVNRAKRMEWTSEVEKDLFQYEDYLDAISEPCEQPLISGAQLPEMLSDADQGLPDAFGHPKLKSPFSTD
ncbi:hypothetical protein [Magnetococcus sp. PR-3]|uniref:hypothetical protein n=1 Tax=Magnetococcus sp. PR-3 TaxID=3120355 RepID=UPI002FCE6105